jgi:hypothetical protein
MKYSMSFFFGDPKKIQELNLNLMALQTKILGK